MEERRSIPAAAWAVIVALLALLAWFVTAPWLQH
jgi:hypothetical protein